MGNVSGGTSDAVAGDAPTSPASSPSSSPVVGVTRASGLLAAATSRAAPSSRPLEQHAASTSAAFRAWVAADGDDVWSLVLTKFARRQLHFDLAAHALAEQHEGNAELRLGAMGNAIGGTSTGAAGGTPTSPLSPPSPSRAAGVIAASGLLPASTPPPKERHDVGASTAGNNPGLNCNGGSALTDSSSGPVAMSPPRAAAPTQTLEEHGVGTSAEGNNIGMGDPASLQSSSSTDFITTPPPPGANGGVAAHVKAAADAGNINGTSEQNTSSSVFPLLGDVHLQQQSSATNGGLETGAQSPANTSQHRDNVKEAEVAQQLADKKKLLEDEVEKLKARLLEADEKQKGMKEHFLQKEYDVLMERLLLREKRVKMEEEAAARAQRLTRSNSHGGITGARGCPSHHAAVQALYGNNIHDGSVGGRGCPAHREAVQTLYGNNAMSELILPLLQCSRMSAATPTPEDRSAASTVTPAATPQAEDDMWNKRQINYVFYLGLAVALMFLIRPFLPHVFDWYFLAAFAGVWGVGSIGLPVGIFGTSRFEKDCSRHTGRFVSLFFSLMVIYAAYLLALTPVNTDGSIPCPPPSAPDGDNKVALLRYVFGFVGCTVSICHIASWAMGCRTGGDRYLLPLG